MSESQFKEKPPCSIKQAIPSEVTCPECAHVNEVWSDDESPVCKKCNASLKGL